MSWTSLWVHMVFCTKYRKPYLNSQIRQRVFLHIKENAAKKNIWLDVVNGYSDHAHCLFVLGRDQTLADVARLIKGESSFWINQNKLTSEKFVWQDDYWAVSVSERHIARVRQYILNQEAHHTKKTFKEEIDRFTKKYGWQPNS
ncbi:IS200/IS605 family transposase [Dyadobacter arcticus]|uniref:REP element-mobilizing transposase RayT n=1 Tax=Dyadobacter arcticus TaxID=1078754 RepID=A0ABX0UR99_9BACT|nr:IS200/IS605 family transposase [Dyadobacter arcticus]NIJ55526.1 REP element-mobilizing transposase RayT [Dyadobacter arcticus]